MSWGKGDRAKGSRSRRFEAAKTLHPNTRRGSEAKKHHMNSSKMGDKAKKDRSRGWAAVGIVEEKIRRIMCRKAQARDEDRRA